MIFRQIAVALMSLAYVSCHPTNIGVRRSPSAEPFDVGADESIKVGVRRKRSSKYSEISPNGRTIDIEASVRSIGKEAQRPKIAVLFRGESFRSQGAAPKDIKRSPQFGAHKRRTCEGSSLTKQMDLSAHHKNIISNMTKLGIDVDVFGLTYPCPNGENYTDRLYEMYAPYIPKNGIDVISKNGSMQLFSMQRVLRKALNSGKKYDGLYLMRWDYGYPLFKKMTKPECYTDPLPRNLQYFGSGNPDGLLYVPGNYAEQMLSFMELDASPCCTAPCAQQCNLCIPNFYVHLGLKHDGKCNPPCFESETEDKRTCTMIGMVEDGVTEEPLDVDDVWCGNHKEAHEANSHYWNINNQRQKKRQGSDLMAQYFGMGPDEPLSVIDRTESSVVEAVDKTLTAYCIVGDVRTFPQVSETLAAFLHNSDGVGMHQSRGPDVFMLLGLNDDANFKGLYNRFNFTANHSQAEVRRIQDLLKPVSLEYHTSAGEATADNVYSNYVAPGSMDCFSAKGWKAADKYPAFWLRKESFARSMNQVQHMKTCLSSVQAYEISNGRRYNVVVIARPDLKYGTVPVPDIFGTVAAGDHVRQQRDYLFMFKRELMDNFFTRTGPLQCNWGDKCCGRVTRSEDLFEFILGMDHGCHCVNDQKPKASKWWRNWTVDICRPWAC